MRVTNPNITRKYKHVIIFLGAIEDSENGTEESIKIDPRPGQSIGEPSIKIVWQAKPRIKGEIGNAATILTYSNAVVFRYQRGKFMCAYCSEMFTNGSEVRRHSVIHDKLKIFERKIAKSDVKNPFPLRIDISDLACIVCGTPVQNLDDLKTHLSHKHSKNTDSEYSDGVLPFLLTDKDYKCVHCSFTCAGFLSLMKHMNQHYRNFVCSVCGKGFLGRDRHRRHFLTHDSGQYKCSGCDFVFPNSAARERHYAVAHGKKKKYKCPICDETFISYYTRVIHLKKKHDQKTDHKCTLCPAIFSTKNGLYSHQRGVHFGKKKKDIDQKFLWQK